MDIETFLNTCPYESCRREFSTKYNLARHIQSCHFQVRRFECSICKLKLATKQSLTEHQYTHTGEKPFKCQVPGCSKQYRQSSQLSVHKKTHQRAAHCEEMLGSPLPLILAARAKRQRHVVLPLHPMLLQLLANF